MIMKVGLKVGLEVEDTQHVIVIDLKVAMNIVANDADNTDNIKVA